MGAGGMRMHRLAGAVVVAMVSVVAFALPSVAVPGQLDPSFGAGGTVITEFPSSYSGARAVAVQADGRVVAAGFAHTNDSLVSDFALTRYDVTGVLDGAFGIGGRVRTDFGGRFDGSSPISSPAPTTARTPPTRCWCRQMVGSWRRAAVSRVG